MSDLYNNLKYLRKRKGISQSKLADLLNVSQTSIAHYELGTRQPSIDLLKKLSSFYDTSIDTIVGNKLEPKRIETNNNKEVVNYLVKCLIEKNKNEFNKIMKSSIINKKIA